MEFFCYILKCSDGSFYTGWSTDPLQRLDIHNRGRGAKYTRSRLPVQLVYTEICGDKSAALKRERAIKALSHAQKESLLRKKFPR
jgi:putative endonuclease